MAYFCRRTLAYMTGQPLKNYAKKQTVEMAKELFAQLHAKRAHPRVAGVRRGQG